MGCSVQRYAPTDTSSTAALFYVVPLGSLPQIPCDNLGIPSSTMKNYLPLSLFFGVNKAQNISRRLKETADREIKNLMFNA